MKKFAFPLDRVLHWRRTQVRLEQVKLEKLLRELGEVDARAAQLQRDVESSVRTLLQSNAALGSELAALESFRAASRTKSRHLAHSGKESLARVRAQREVLALKERDVKLLERLRENRMAAWHSAAQLEIDQQAEEAFLARWHRS